MPILFFQQLESLSLPRDQEMICSLIHRYTFAGNAMEIVITITEEMITKFFSGLGIVLILLGVGSLIFAALKKMESHYRFSRFALALALAPMTMIKFLDFVLSRQLYVFAGITILAGLILDGVKAMAQLEIRKAVPPARSPAEAEEQKEVFAWEKAE